jgi:hypothetical protein
MVPDLRQQGPSLLLHEIAKTEMGYQMCLGLADFSIWETSETQSGWAKWRVDP